MKDKNKGEVTNPTGSPQFGQALGTAGRGGGGGGMGGPFGGMFVEGRKPQNTKKTLVRLLALLKSQLIWLMLALLLVIVGSVASLVATRMIGVAIDSYIVPGDLQGLVRYVSWLALVYGIGAGATWAQAFVMVGVSQRSVAKLRSQLFERIQVLPIAYFDQHPRGEIMSRLANDVEALAQTLSSSTTQVFASVITVVGAVVAMLLLSPMMTLVTLVSVPLATFISRSIARYTRHLYRERQQTLGRLNGLIEESVTGQRVVQAFGQEKRMMQEFRGTNRKLCEAGTRAEIYGGMVRPIMTVANNLSYAVLAVLGGILVLRGALRVGQIASFIQYNRQFSGPVNELANQFNSLQAAIAGLERVHELLDEVAEQADRPHANALHKTAGEVEFENVSFGYRPDVPVLKDISLHASPGSTIALVGPTGAGKTTIVNLLMRFYEVQQGRICIDGQDIKDITRDSLRSSLGVVLQDTYLFSGTVLENVRFGRLDATDKEVYDIATLVGANGFIERLPQGYDTVLTEDGQNISHGQRQLLAITRAALADARILILDEATSSVDTRTELHVQRAMATLMKGRTSFVIAHRLSTIRQADEIIVIDNGQIAERGTHEQLLETGGFYAKLYTSQFRREELVREAI